MQLGKITATGQLAITVLFFVGYFGVLLLFLFGYVKTPPGWADMLKVLLGVLTGAVSTIVAFWFNRSRQQEPPPGGEGGGQ